MMKYSSCDHLGGLPVPRSLIPLGLSHLPMGRGAGNPRPEVLEVLSCTDPLQAQLFLPSMDVLLGSFLFLEQGAIPKGLFLSSQSPNATISNCTPGRDLESLVLIWYLGILWSRFCLIYLGLAFRYQIQSVRFATATLGADLWGTSSMQINAALKHFFPLKN